MTGGSDAADGNLSPSCRFVLDVLEREGPLTRQELLGRTYLREPTLDRTLDTLQNEEFILKARDSDDLRQVVIKMRTKRTYNPSQD